MVTEGKNRRWSTQLEVGELTRTDMKVAGMSPSMVAERNVPYGIPTIGEAMLMKVFGKVGVILRNSM